MGQKGQVVGFGKDVRPSLGVNTFAPVGVDDVDLTPATLEDLSPFLGKRAFEVAARTPERGYVLDLLEWRERAETAQTPMTVADLTLQCLIARLEEMKREGDQRFQRHRNLALMQREWATEHCLRLMAQPGYESLTVSAICLPRHIPGSDFVAKARALLNVQLSAGYGDTKDRAFRIAAMGHTSERDMQRVLKGLSLLLTNWSQLE